LEITSYLTSRGGSKYHEDSSAKLLHLLTLQHFAAIKTIIRLHMAPYVPKEYPQERGWKQGDDALDAHETELCKNGPAPPNHLVE
jgi:hypothetical protein